MPNDIETDKFLEGVNLLFPDSQSARLSRALENSQRNVQKWVNGNEPVPAHAAAFVEQQVAILQTLQPSPYDTMKTMVDQALKTGLHPEVVAAILSRLYDDVVGKPIR